jgi:hypothetical protein
MIVTMNGYLKIDSNVYLLLLYRLQIIGPH